MPVKGSSKTPDKLFMAVKGLSRVAAQVYLLMDAYPGFASKQVQVF